MANDNKKPSTNNKGVNIEMVHERPERDSNASEIETDSFSQSPSKSLKKIRQDFQTIIDIMGPHTPKSSQATSNDADNEESVYSNTGFSTKYKPPDCSTETDTVPSVDISLNEETDVSMAVDKSNSTPQTDSKKRTHSCHCKKSEMSTNEIPISICPPPMIPANVCLNSECMCPQIANYLMYPKTEVPLLYNPCQDNFTVDGKHSFANKRSSFIKWIKNIGTSYEQKGTNGNRCEFYKMNMKRADDHSPPRKFTFELVTDVPMDQSNEILNPVFCKCTDQPNEMLQPCRCSERFIHKNGISAVPLKSGKTTTFNFENEEESRVMKDFYETNVNDQDWKFKSKKYNRSAQDDVKSNKTEHKTFVGRTTYYDNLDKTKVDVYYFDHGSPRYFKTTDRPPLILTEGVAEKTEAKTTKFWAEIFGAVHVGLSFFTSFILQVLRFILYGLLRPLTIGVIQLLSDYFFKPFLATCFNALIQPVFIFLYNILTSLRDICDPVAEGIGYFLRECAVLVGAFRIVEVKNECGHNSAGCGIACNKSPTRKQFCKRPLN